MQMTFLSKTFANSLNTQKQYGNDIWEKSNDADSLWIRDTDHISIFMFYVFFFTTISTSKGKVKLFSERELKKALRDKYINASRVVWTLIDNDKLANQIAKLAAILINLTILR